MHGHACFREGAEWTLMSESEWPGLVGMGWSSCASEDGEGDNIKGLMPVGFGFESQFCHLA